MGSSSFPVPDPSASLGVDGSLNPSSWGHMAPKCLAQLAPTAFRFYGRSSCHPRVIHFRSSSSPLISYFSSGTGSVQIPLGPYALYSDHTALYIPQQASSNIGDQGDGAMAYEWAYVWDKAHWNIGNLRTASARW